LNIRVDFGCSASELSRERKGYFTAFSKLGVAGTVGATPQLSAKTNGTEQFFLYPDPPNTPIPDNLVAARKPTACFQIDTFSKPNWKALWASLFDYVFVFHPGFERYFKKYGHNRVFLIPHAVMAEAYNSLGADRTYEVGWIGRTDGELYKARRRVLPQLAQRYKMNDWRRNYAEDEIPNVYCRARIVLNIGRDDYPKDANLRCFEVMASGALLVTSLPTELEQIGFKNGIHFVGYASETEMFQIVDRFLKDEEARSRIAEAGRALVMSDHTYDARARTLLRIIESDGAAYFAPARKWNRERIAFIYLHYHCKRGSFAQGKAIFARLVRNAPLLALRGLPLLLRGWQHNRNGKR
jgi:hypothetical protein